jgi:shikimate dehydrogenase
MTRKTGVIGYPLKHSLSPIFQQAALDYYKLDVSYELWETEAGQLPLVIENIRSDNYIGANVTIPYKESVIPMLDTLDTQSSMIEAVNTIVKRDGRLYGYNTDAQGFIKALRDDARFDPEDQDILVLGAGGAARAISFALVQQRVRSITLINRTISHAENIALMLGQLIKTSRMNTRVNILPWRSSKLLKTVDACKLIINCTSFGTRYSALEGESPVDSHLLHPGMLVFDLVYNPGETPLLKMAKEAGARTLGGLPMLIYQGAAAFTLWTGLDAPVDIMTAAAISEIGYKA